MMPKGKNTVRFKIYAAVKAILDFVFSLVFLVALLPLFLAVAVIIKIDSRGPVFFKQKRTGKNGCTFEMYKFRSMTVDNDVFDNSCGDKYTRVGKILRQTSIDELPQLLNILFGQMSFVGPRPWMVEYWANMDDGERVRSKVRPGITGLAAAKGRNGLSILEKIAYDLEYVEKFSFSQDVKVILLTVKTVLTREEASSNKEVIRQELDVLRKRNEVKL